MTACLDSSKMLAFVEGRLDEVDSGTVLAHLVSCVPCRTTIADLSNRPADGPEASRSGPPSIEESIMTRVPSGDDTGSFDPGLWRSPGTSTQEGISGWSNDLASVAPPGYEILGWLGQGGMGIVYKARHLGLGRLVALKMIREGSIPDPVRRARFRIEAEAVARLQHPNIVQVYDVGEFNGRPFVSLEFLEGGTLSDRLVEATLPPRTAAELVATLSRAIEAAHRANVIHRDLKPSNVLYATDGTPKVADFGLAKKLEADDGHTLMGQVLGSPSYMAPEQARGDALTVGPSADIYALGAVLYTLLTGHPPFKASTAFQTVYQVIHDIPMPPSRLQPRLPRDIETICLKCLEKDPSRRYPTAEALAIDLENFGEGRPIHARRTPGWERAAKWARRRPAEAALLVSAVLTSAGGVGGLFWYQDARYRQRLEETQRETRRIQDENDRVERLRAEANPDLVRGLDSVARNDWSAARLVLTRTLARVGDEPRLADLRARARELLERSETEIALRESVDADRGRFRQFLEFRDETLFHEVRFPGLGLVDDPEAVQRPARAALALYPGRVPEPPRSLPEKDRLEVADGSYSLRIILAAAEPDPREGLKQLELASAIRPPTRAYHLRLAACLEALGDKPAAKASRDRAAGLEPSTATDYFLTGHERFRANLWEEARADFDAALSLQPDHFWSECLLAVCYLQLNRPVEARAGLNACLRAEPDAPWLLLLRAVASGKVAEITRMVAVRDQALAPRAAEAFRSAEADYLRAIKNLGDDPGSSVDLHYAALVNRGVLRAQAGDDDRATADLNAAIELAPELHVAHAELGQLLARRGKTEEASDRLGHAIARRPDRAELYRARADLVLLRDHPTTDQVEAALSDLDQALQREKPENPARARDLANRGWLLAQTGRLVEGLAAMDQALQVKPDYAIALRQRVGLLIRLKRDDEAARACDELLSQGARWAWPLEFRGLIRERRGDRVGAIADLTEALVLEPRRADLLIRRGWCYLLSDAARLAETDFDRSLTIEAWDGEALAGRSITRALLGRPREAVDDAEASIAQGSPDPRRLILAARAYVLASNQVAAEVARLGRDAVILAGRYDDRAVSLVNEAVRRQPPADRETYLRDRVLDDPVFRRLRRRFSTAGPVESKVSTTGSPR